MWNKALTTAGFIFIARTDLDTGIGLDRSLRVIGRPSTFYADRVGFCDKFRDRQELRHRLERLARVILIQTGDDHTLANFCKPIDGVDDRELSCREK